MADASDLKSVGHPSQRQTAPKSYDNPSSHLAAFLAYMSRRNPDLAAVVRAWPKLPEAVRAGILAMVKATGERR